MAQRKIRAKGICCDASWVGGPPPEEERIKQIEESLKQITAKMYREVPLYPVWINGTQIAMTLPFIDRFHQFFLKRRWKQPERDPRRAVQNILRLSPPGNNSDGNYSQNYWNYNHFVNVVAALARLIAYFKDKKAVSQFLEQGPETTVLVKNYSQLSEILAYTEYTDKEEAFPNLRTFQLMLAGFYHDIGKTIVDPRHGMEGSIIMIDHPSLSRYHINQIVKKYNNSYEFEPDDLLFLGYLLYYHDQYGTLNTGEDNYLRLVDVITRGFSLKHSEKQEDQAARDKDRIRKYLFDLWLLNVADIMVSLKKKWSLQEWWETEKTANDKIRQFFTTPYASRLIHDLLISFKLLDYYINDKFVGDSSRLDHEALKYSEDYVIERLSRLVASSLRRPLKVDEQEAEEGSLVQHIHDLSIGNLDSVIAQVIESTADLNEFCIRFSKIGKMDYALGFFERIARRALEQIQEEMRPDTTRQPTGWISTRKPEDFQDNSDYFYKMQAQLFINNYITVVIQIISCLLFQGRSIEHIRNIEFFDATTRLVDEKLDKIISLEGPFRSRRSTQLILKSIYLY